MRQREQADLGLARDLGCVGRGRVLRLARAVALVVAEGRLVDEQVGARARPRHARDGARVAGEDDRPPGPRRPEHLAGVIVAAVRKRDGVAALERAALRPGRDAERVGSHDVEAARPRMLDQRVADRRDACATEKVTRL